MLTCLELESERNSIMIQVQGVQIQDLVHMMRYLEMMLEQIRHQICLDEGTSGARGNKTHP